MTNRVREHALRVTWLDRVARVLLILAAAAATAYAGGTLPV